MSVALNFSESAMRGFSTYSFVEETGEDIVIETCLLLCGWPRTAIQRRERKKRWQLCMMSYLLTEGFRGINFKPLESTERSVSESLRSVGMQ